MGKPTQDLPPPPPYSPRDTSPPPFDLKSHPFNHSHNTQEPPIAHIVESNILPHIRSSLSSSSSSSSSSRGKTSSIALIPSDVPIVQPGILNGDEPLLDFAETSSPRGEHAAAPVLLTKPAAQAAAENSPFTTTTADHPSTPGHLDMQPGDQRIEGFPETESVVFVQFRGGDYNSGFWTGVGLLESLETAVRQAVAREAQSSRSNTVFNDQKQSSSTREALGREEGQQLGQEQEMRRSEREGGARFGGRKERPPKQCGDVGVKVAIEDLCVRYVTEMGLFDTRSGRGVVVRVSV